MRAELITKSFTADAKDLSLVVVALDDTDDETRAISTGALASLIAARAVELGGCLRLEVTRHQLLLREDIPYTSHNSAMAFEVDMPTEHIDILRKDAIDIIAEHRAPTSDPGLCFAQVPSCDVDKDFLQALIDFGHRAKVEYCSIEAAYALANRIPWVKLSEHGGDGSGVVGALAGVGLRLGGNDGRFRGRWDFAKLCVGVSSCTVGAVAKRLSHDFRGVVTFLDIEKKPLPSDMPFSFDKEGKPILLNGALNIVCTVQNGIAYPCSKMDLGNIGNEGEQWSQACSFFEWDNDEEECMDYKPSCKNCLHRRLVAGGFRCEHSAVRGDRLPASAKRRENFHARLYERKN